MSEAMPNLEPALNLVPDKRHNKEDGFEVFNQLYEALRPQAEALVNQAAELYKKASAKIMRLVPGDWDINRFPEPATEPVPVSLVRLLDAHGNPARELELKIRGKDQISLAYHDDGTLQYEHLFQRINPKDLTPDQRIQCAYSIRKAQSDLLLVNNHEFMDPEKHDKQLAGEIDAIEKGIDQDIWIPFDAKGMDANGNEAVHLIKWGGRRPQELVTTIFASMADASAYRDNTANIANLFHDHIKIHPVADVFMQNASSILVDSFRPAEDNYDEDGNLVLQKQLPIEEINPDEMFKNINNSNSPSKILKDIQDGDLNIPDVRSLLNSADLIPEKWTSSLNGKSSSD